jgi:hypothetical protein
MTSSVKDFLRLADIGRSRSSSLNQLQWMIAILIAGILAFQLAHAPSWLTILLAVLLTVDFALFSTAFSYFMVKRRHALRSEAFDLKMSELIQRREVEIDAGQYHEVSEASGLRAETALPIAPRVKKGTEKQ